MMSGWKFGDNLVSYILISVIFFLKYVTLKNIYLLVHNSFLKYSSGFAQLLIIFMYLFIQCLQHLDSCRIRYCYMRVLFKVINLSVEFFHLIILPQDYSDQLSLSTILLALHAYLTYFSSNTVSSNTDTSLTTATLSSTTTLQCKIRLPHSSNSYSFFMNY